MVKKKTAMANAIVFGFVFILAMAIFSVSVAAPELVCSYKNTPCIATPPGNAETKVLGASNFTNAHAENSSQNNYDWNVCCKIQGIKTDNACFKADTNVTGLNSSVAKTNYTDAHVESPFWSISNKVPSPTNTCISADPGTILCYTENRTVSSLKPGQVCLFTQSNITNAHVGNCTGPDTYGWVTWCTFNSQTCGSGGQQCCSGLCQVGLICENNICVPKQYPCGDGVADPGETCLNCPMDVGQCDEDSGVWVPPFGGDVTGVVRNITGEPVAGAVVSLLGTALSVVTAADGSYIINDVPAGTYDVFAGKPSDGYADAVKVDLGVVSDVGDVDFTLVKALDGCNDDCTKADGLCHAECGGKGWCVFESPETASACDFAAPGIMTDPDDPSMQIICCSGVSYAPVKADVKISCGGDVLSAKKPVFFRGRIVNIVVTTFKAESCR